jgi:hypothetical protein
MFQHVSFDYKTTGSDFLGLMQAEFDHPSLTSDRFEAFVAGVANDLAEHAFGPLATLVADDGLELWQIDFFEDTVHMALVPSGQVDAFKAWWTTGYRDDPATAHAVRPKLRRVKAKPLPPPAARRADLAVATVTLPADPYIGIDCPLTLLYSRFSDHPDNGSYADAGVWPPATLALPTARTDPDFLRRWQPVCRDGAQNVWACREPDGMFRLAHIDDMAAWSPTWLGGDTPLPGYPDDVKRMGERMIHTGERRPASGKPTYEVSCVTATSTECWYDSRKPLQVFPFPDGERCAIVEDDTRIAIAAGPVTQADFVLLPKPLYAPETGVIPLAGDTVVFFSGTKTRLRMHRLDLATMRHDTCVLQHFGHRGVDRGERYATFGNLEVRQGHGDWWILNHKSNQFGTIDIALLWNAATDDTVVIEQGDIELRQPTVIYQRALGRYLAVSGETVALLREFDEIVRGKEAVRLVWDAR